MREVDLISKDKANCKIGDVVEFKVGGLGVIVCAKESNFGWPASYGTEKVKGAEDHPTTKRAWHVEDDFKKVYEGLMHFFESEGE